MSHLKSLGEKRENTEGETVTHWKIQCLKNYNDPIKQNKTDLINAINMCLHFYPLILSDWVLQKYCNGNNHSIIQYFLHDLHSQLHQQHLDFINAFVCYL